MNYISPPVQTDPAAIQQAAYDYLQAAMPGWQPADGNLDTLIIEAFALVAAEQADIAASVLTSVFRYFGILVGVPPIDAVPATSTATFTMTDNAGYTIPAGSVVGLTDSSGVVQGFDLNADLVIPNGSTTGAGAVTAETPGASQNGLSGTAQLVNVPAAVVSATLTAAVGGLDPEDDGVYLNRLTETLTLLSPRPILAPDFAVIARSVAGVFRATGVDNLKPGPPWGIGAEASGQEKVVTVAVTDVNGLSVGSTIRGNVTALLQSEREQNFVIYVVDPNYTNIDVTCAVVAWPSYDLTDVTTRVTTALTTLLSPANWSADPSGNAARWSNDPTLRLSEIHAAIMRVDGVRYVKTLTFGVHGGGLATTDVTLGSGSALPALPTVGTLTPTVTYS